MRQAQEATLRARSLSTQGFVPCASWPVVWRRFAPSHGAKWMANGGPASLAAVRWPHQRFAVWSTPLSRKRCPFRGMSGKRACFLWGSVFARTTVHPGKKYQGAGAFSAPLQHHRRCRTVWRWRQPPGTGHRFHGVAAPAALRSPAAAP